MTDYGRKESKKLFLRICRFPSLFEEDMSLKYCFTGIKFLLDSTFHVLVSLIKGVLLTKTLNLKQFVNVFFLKKMLLVKKYAFKLLVYSNM
jgi:hypothetical protein